MPHATRPGDLLGDRYQLVDLLTESEGGRFWRAYDRVLERHVAIHVIRGDDERAPALMEAARRSATVLDRRVLRVLDAECTDDQCYVVNEWGWGTSLDIVAAGSGALGARRAAWLVSEVADSIAVAHAAGVTHGRLNPENVLVDRAGGVRIIGLCVDAALHGLVGPDGPPPGGVQHDIDDLAGLLYCALTSRWAGASGSIVPAAPRGHGEVLRPRQVRAGIPRTLDLLCEEVLHRSPDRAPGTRHRELDDVVASARGVADYLAEFVGDPTGMPAALLASTPDVLPDEEQVVLPPVPEMLPHAEAPQPVPVPEPEPEPETTVLAATDEDRPTEAGVPIFGDDDDVSWLERRTTPAPPPPPFEAPPERPLFAPEPAAGAAPRTPRQGQGARSGPGGGKDDHYWPWDTGAGASTSSSALAAVTDEPVPGRGFLRLGVLLAALVLLAVAVVVAVNLGNGGSDPGSDPSGTASTGEAGRAGRQARGPVISGVSAAAFDPQGDPPSENDEEAGAAVDGDPATTWSTEGYNDQLGPPPGLKLGVGLVLDLGEQRSVGQVSLSFVGTPTSVSLFVTEGRPDSVDGLDPVAQGSADGPRLTLDAGGARGSHLVVWLTALPVGDDGRFRGTVSEVVVRAAPGE
ncbi:protein kinase family protein [Nocardioides rubriscoriae]|uniref:protein kinase family protein n=1 Tax=Nocardioides rubriscoriae TaxID=642762 RepID=UPI0011DF54E5|nr:protein kinase family protein [Nocardioides rubriscoriae]